jgi:hypothetical protein
MGLVTFVGLVSVCILVAAAVALINLLQRYLEKHDPKLL